jgi:hypothetical protein
MSLHIASGNYRAAFAISRRSEAGPTPQAAFLLMKSGKRREAEHMAEETIDRCRRLLSRGSENPRPIWEGASAFAVEGKRDSALAWMRSAVDAGWRDYRLAERDPLLESLRTNSSFRALMAETRERVAEMRAALSGIPF